MKSITRLSLLLLLSAALFTSCKKSAPKQTKHIPKNAVFVAVINTQAITRKLATSEASLENLFKSMADDTAATKGKQEWEDFRNSGIDLSENFYLSVVQKGGGMPGQGGASILTAIGGVDDEAKLQAYLKKKQPGAEVKKEKDYSYANLSDNSVVAWNKDMVMMMSNQEQAAMKMEYDSITGELNFQKPASSIDLKTELTAYFTMDEDQSVASIPEFRDLMQENADGSFWINSASSLEGMPIQLPKVKELVENSFTASTINFEDGKVVAEMKSYSSPALRDILKKYAGPSVDMSLLEKYPSANINGFLAFAFNPEMINAIIKHLEMKAMADQFLSNALGGTYTVEDVTKAIKGDMALVVSDFQMPQMNASQPMTRMASPVKMLLNIPVGDKAQMNRLMDNLVQKGMLVKNGNEYRASEAISMSGYQVLVNEKSLLIASDEQTLSQYVSGTAKATIADDVKDDMKGKAAAMYVNIESIFKGIPADSTGAGMGSAMAKGAATFRDMKGYAENFNGKYTAGQFELRMKNEKENSLVSMMQFFGEVGKTAKDNMKVQRQMPVPSMRDTVEIE